MHVVRLVGLALLVAEGMVDQEDLEAAAARRLAILIPLNFCW